ncbi:orotidine-5'-phosphate decarboxylase [Salisediminibacterium halotolerans]|uniref:orotidine-5'-phosphate decarboxylase n=1 Tax=Salisediminibacterium halotolerans TaxID=517425 RepID=UPI000F139938|nr:orotidine-5'-phosphate decarboxylase [Salisediminibacterium halotolerans]RLJ74284.1 orotidine-5'-phosphate decarboxylase [Actinophytocola xinjiangensis]RPE87623.1 orotidine-5'-phosphate decarboxylase [Salisediminibacterium halotolerans]TWG35121.1 orotidine-5'-phosphate decarboxylase [Salisediminibacterium halotolerans]GEL07320.1 orotidine 5'-phosphate decarboxylase [Salisediminibacterium halotolerans]
MQISPLYIALDKENETKALAFLNEFKEETLDVKVGMELYFREGPRIVETIKQAGHRVFIDLKIHDIPVTAEKAMRNLAKLEPDCVNVHALGGKEMMKRAKEGLTAGTPASKEPPLCLAVTHLTSSSQEMLRNDLAIATDIQAHVLQLSASVYEAGLDGVICSALDVSAVKEHFPLYALCPGIRRKADEPDDQKRAVTPREAREFGADAIVVGRGITKASSPQKAYQDYIREWLKER